MIFVTMGPEGSCHENATQQYLRYHGIEDAEIILKEDVLEALDMVYDNKADFLVQNSAHTTVDKVTEKYFREVYVSDTFIYTTLEMALLEDVRVERPRTLGLVAVTEGYISDLHYDTKIHEITKPIVTRKFLEGAYDAALTHLRCHTEHPGRFRVRRYIGCIPTAWIVYGKKTLFTGEMAGIAPRGFYTQGTGVSDWPRGGSVYSAPPGLIVEEANADIPA